MNRKRSKERGWSLPSATENKSVEKHFVALLRVASVAARAGANAKDIAAAKVWPLLWALEVTRRHELEPLAEIGRKVSKGAPVDSSELLDRDFEVAACACRLLLAGAKQRGLATKIKRELKCSESVRHINRILNRWMPIILSDFGRNRTHLLMSN